MIDLGYNSLKMVSYTTGPRDSFKAYGQRGALTKIGEGLHESGNLGTEPMERTIRELKMLDEFNLLERVQKVLPVATSPVREAENGRDFLKMAKAEAGLKFRVLSGKEEALLSYIGAAKSTRFPDALYFDLGGGSLELAYANEFRIRRTLSLPLGALRMTELYGEGKNKFRSREYDRMRRTIEELLPTRDELGLSPDTALVGVGGSIRAIARYDQYLRNYPLNKLHNYTIRRKSVQSIHRALRKMGLQKIARVELFGKDRAESITAGSLIISMLMDRLDMEKIVVSTHGLRDGVLAEYLEDPASYGKSELTESRAEKLLAGRFGNGEWTERFSRDLASAGVLEPDEKRILDEAAGWLLDGYLSTGAESLFYSIMSEDSILEHADQMTLALSMVRAKAPKSADWFYSCYESLLKHGSEESIEKLAAFMKLLGVLRLTDSRAAAVVKGRRLRLRVVHRGRRFPRSLLDYSARELREATGLKVKAVLSRGTAIGETHRKVER